MKALKANKINFVGGKREQPARKKKVNSKAKYVWPLVILLLLVGGASGYYAYNIFFVIEPQIEASRAYTEDASKQEEYEAIQQVMTTRDVLAAEAANLNEVFKNLGSYPEMTTDIYNAIKAPAGDSLRVLGMDYSAIQGIVRLSGGAANALRASEYAGALRQSGTFAYTAYYGYEFNNQGYFLFDVLSVMKTGGDGNE